MHHPFASQEAFEAPDEDPQPTKPSPVCRAMQAQLAGEGVTPQEHGVYRFEHEEWLRPTDLLEELREYDMNLIPGIFLEGDSHGLLDLDTYTGIAIKVTDMAWQLRLENIDGYSRTLSYATDHPLSASVHDNYPEQAVQAEYALALDMSTAEQLQTEILSFIEWLSAQCPDAKLRRQLAARQAVTVERPEVATVAPARARRFGWLSFRLLRR